MSRRPLIGACALAVGAIAVGFAAAADISGRGSSPRGAKPGKPVAKETNAPRAVVGSSPTASTSDDVAAYWTPERMRSAKPADRTLRQSSPSTAPTRPAVEAGTAPTARPARARPKSTPARKTRAQADSPVVSSRSTSENAVEYWTPERMQEAGPKEQVVPGGDGSQDSAGAGAPAVAPGVP